MSSHSLCSQGPAVDLTLQSGPFFRNYQIQQKTSGSGQRAPRKWTPALMIKLPLPLARTENKFCKCKLPIPSISPNALKGNWSLSHPHFHATAKRGASEMRPQVVTLKTIYKGICNTECGNSLDKQLGVLGRKRERET